MDSEQEDLCPRPVPIKSPSLPYPFTPSVPEVSLMLSSAQWTDTQYGAGISSYQRYFHNTSESRNSEAMGSRSSRSYNSPSVIDSSIQEFQTLKPRIQEHTHTNSKSVACALPRTDSFQHVPVPKHKTTQEHKQQVEKLHHISRNLSQSNDTSKIHRPSTCREHRQEPCGNPRSVAKSQHRTQQKGQSREELDRSLTTDLCLKVCSNDSRHNEEHSVDDNQQRAKANPKNTLQDYDDIQFTVRQHGTERNVLYGGWKRSLETATIGTKNSPRVSVQRERPRNRLYVGENDTNSTDLPSSFNYTSSSKEDNVQRKENGYEEKVVHSSNTTITESQLQNMILKILSDSKIISVPRGEEIDSEDHGHSVSTQEIQDQTQKVSSDAVHETDHKCYQNDSRSPHSMESRNTYSHTKDTNSESEKQVTLTDLFELYQSQASQIQNLHDKLDKVLFLQEITLRSSNCCSVSKGMQNDSSSMSGSNNLRHISTQTDETFHREVAVATESSETASVGIMAEPPDLYSLPVRKSNPSQRRDVMDSKPVQRTDAHSSPCHCTSANEELLPDQSICINSMDLPSVQMHVPSPMPSIHVDMQDYEEDENEDDSSNSPLSSHCHREHNTTHVDSEEPPRVGWTFYNQVVDQVNKLLEDQTEMRVVRERNQDVEGAQNRPKAYDMRSATVEQLQKMGIGVCKGGQEDSNACRNNPAHHPAPADNGNRSNSSILINALAMKYLKENNFREAKVCNFSMKTNFSLATLRYLERYHLLPQQATNGNARDNVGRKHPGPSTRGGNADKVLDITTIRNQPKLL